VVSVLRRRGEGDDSLVSSARALCVIRFVFVSCDWVKSEGVLRVCVCACVGGRVAAAL
jgi:hypothetical protein